LMKSRRGLSGLQSTGMLYLDKRRLVMNTWNRSGESSRIALSLLRRLTHTYL
jgi:hypothetical protein